MGGGVRSYCHAEKSWSGHLEANKNIAWVDILSKIIIFFDVNRRSHGTKKDTLIRYYFMLFILYVR